MVQQRSQRQQRPQHQQRYQQQQRLQQQQRPLYALLVGIDEHEAESGLPSLRGCINDVRALARLLTEQYDVPAAHILTLENQNATRTAIQTAFQDHLVAAAESWQQRSGGIDLPGDPAPSFFFHFSGYGSQARDPWGHEPSGMDATLVAHDSRTPGVYDLRAWELGEWIAQLSAITEDVVVVLDCSTSTPCPRADDLPLVRACPADLRLAPHRRSTATADRQRRALSPSGWQLGADNLLIAACRAGEMAHELSVGFGAEPEQAGGERRQWRGALSACLTDLLASAPARSGLDTGALLADLRNRFGGTLSGQLPQTEGGLDRAFLGGLLPVKPLWTVAEDPAHVLLRQPVRASRRGVKILLTSPRARFRLAQRIESTVDARPLYPWLEPVAHGEDLRVEQTGDAVYICDFGGEPLAGPFPADELEDVARALARIARCRNLLALRSAPALAHALDFSVRQLDLSRPMPGAIAIPPGGGGEPAVYAGTRLVFAFANRGAVPLYFSLLNLTESYGVSLVWSLERNTHAPLLPGERITLGMTADKDDQFACVLPAGVDSARDRYLVIAGTAPVDFALLQHPDSDAPAPGQARPEQLALVERALAALVDGVAPGLDGAAFGLDGAAPSEAVRDAAWVVAHTQLTVLAPPQALPVAPAPAALNQAAPVLTADAPAGFSGSLRFLSQQQAIHLHGVDAVAMPPGLAAFPELFAPLRLDQRERDARAGGGMIEIDCDEQARREITAHTPLRLHLPPQAAKAVIALAQDGEAWFPVGRAAGDASEIAIEWLPQPHPDDAEKSETVRTASPLRTIRLYLFRILDEPAHDLGLFNVRFVPAGWSANASRATFVRKAAGGELRYTPATHFRAGERVALVLHGLGGDSATQSRWLATTLAAKGVRYDRLLAFDYEGVGTSVEENAAGLAKRLAALGVKTAEGITLDVYAHSMGALVARWYIERLGGDRVVHNAVLAAAPNLGTPLADAALLAPWLITLAVNLPLPTASGLLIAWAMGSLASEARGLSDLGRRSHLLEKLNGDDMRAQVRYYLLAGSAGMHTSDDSVDGEDAASARAVRALQTLAEGIHRLADWYFEDANDLVIAVRSSLGVRINHAPGSLMLSRVLRCHHFGYFESEVAAQQVANWFGAASDAPAAQVTVTGSLAQSASPVAGLGAACICV